MHGSHAITHGIEITVRSGYIESQSDPEESHYFFAYEVTIENVGEETVQLLRRSWLISDGSDAEREVSGEGVVGEQPVLAPEGVYKYTSFCPLTSPVGSMRGSYTFAREDSSEFEGEVAPFTLASPNSLH